MSTVDNVENTVKTAAKATKAAAKTTVTPIAPIEITTTKAAINLKLGKQQLALIAGTAVATVGTIKLVQVVKARRNTVRVNNENDLLS